MSNNSFETERIKKLKGLETIKQVFEDLKDEIPLLENQLKPIQKTIYDIDEKIDPIEERINKMRQELKPIREQMRMMDHQSKVIKEQLKQSNEKITQRLRVLEHEIDKSSYSNSRFLGIRNPLHGRSTSVRGGTKRRYKKKRSTRRK
jgi:chromosome segregation ATPase